MGTLILLVCILPPLAVMAIAAFHGLRTASAGILAILMLSLGLLAGPMLLASPEDAPVPGFRFDVARGDANAQRHAALPPRTDPVTRSERGL